MADDGETKLLIECGMPLARIKQALGYRLSEVGGYWWEFDRKGGDAKKCKLKYLHLVQKETVAA